VRLGLDARGLVGDARCEPLVIDEEALNVVVHGDVAVLEAATAGCSTGPPHGMGSTASCEGSGLDAVGAKPHGNKTEEQELVAGVRSMPQMA
jgi:hypothetical protein